MTLIFFNAKHLHLPSLFSGMEALPECKCTAYCHLLTYFWWNLSVYLFHFFTWYLNCSKDVHESVDFKRSFGLLKNFSCLKCEGSIKSKIFLMFYSHWQFLREIFLIWWLQELRPWAVRPVKRILTWDVHFYLGYFILDILLYLSLYCYKVRWYSNCFSSSSGKS